MHGTYRMHIDRVGRVRTVDFARDIQRRRARKAGLLVGGLTLGAVLTAVPANFVAPERRMAMQAFELPAPRRLPTPPVPALAAEHARQPEREVPAAPPVAPLPLAVATDPLPAPRPVVLEIATTAAAPAFVTPPVFRRPALEALPPRKVDIAQVAEPMARSLHVPQLREPGLVAGAAATLAAKVDAMQVRLPAPPQLTGEERAVLLAEAPSEMTVRVGSDAIGTVAFRMGETGTIDVQLSGLLEIVASRMAPAEYTRLRGSVAADSYVSLDQLRAIGLTVRYDAVYDELDVSA